MCMSSVLSGARPITLLLLLASGQCPVALSPQADVLG